MSDHAAIPSAVASRAWRALAEGRARLAALVSWLAARSDAVAAGIILGGVALRLGLAALGWPATDSDEGTMGLMALHIAYHGEHPIFFYGQTYMGALEAYLAAGFFRLFGPSLFALRLSVILLSGGFLTCFYLLARRLVSRGLALFSLALVAVGSQEALFRQIFAGGGYAETLLFGTLALLLAVELARERDGAARRGCGRWLAPSGGWRRLVAYAALGLAVGLGIWSDVLVLPFTLLALGLLALFRWRELWTGAGLALALGLLLGLAPLLVYAAHAPNHNPFSGATAVHQSDNAYQRGVPSLLMGELAGTVVVSVPIMTGGAALLPLGQADMWPLAMTGGPLAPLAALAHGLWGLAYLALLVVALCAGLRAVRPGWAEGRAVIPLDGTRREALVREYGRLALLAGAGVTVLLYAASPVAARDPQRVSRYLIGVMIALPAVLAPLWGLARAPGANRRRVAARVGLSLVLVAFLGGLAEQIGTVPAARATLSQQAALIGELERLGATRVYSEYWTCDRLAFLSQERMLCAALDGQLRPDLDRYMPYRAAVAKATAPFYVFPLGSTQAASFAARAAAAPGAFSRWVRDGYVIYHASAR